MPSFTDKSESQPRHRMRHELLLSGMYTAIPNAVMKSKRLNAVDKVVYGAILNYLGDNETAWPSQMAIADDTGFSTRSVIRSVDRLHEAGFIFAIDEVGRVMQYKFGDPLAPEKQKKRAKKNSPLTDSHRSTTADRESGDRRQTVRGLLTDSQKTGDRQSPELLYRTTSLTTSLTTEGAVTQKGKRKKIRIEPLPELPDHLKTPAIQTAWQSFIEFRREDKRQPVTTRAAALLIKTLDKIGPADAVGAIETSIACGWTGIFPPKQKGSTNGHPQRSRHRADNENLTL